MGSTEHNMGRMAHNAHVYDWLKQEMETYVEEADRLEKLGPLMPTHSSATGSSL